MIAPERPQRRSLRRFLQFRLRTLLVLCTLVALVLASYYTYVGPYEEQYEVGVALSGKGAKLEWRTAQPEWLAKRLSRFRGDEVLRDCMAIDARSSGLTDEDLVLLEKMPRLEKLYLTRRPISDEGLKHLVGLRHLERLSLWGTNVTDEGMRHVGRLPALRVLDIHDVKPNRLAGENITFGTNTVQNSEIRDLHRHVCSNKVTRNCLRHLKGATNLRALHFSFALDDEGLAQLAAIDNLRIRTLCLDGVTYRGLSELPRFRELETLVISRTSLDSGGLRYLARVPKLRSLGLRFVHGSAHGWQALADVSQLEALSIMLSSVDGAGLRSLHGLKRLESLWLEKNGISDEDVAQLAGLTNLRELDLLGESLTADALAGLHDMDQLEDLRLGAALDDEALRSLASMPRLQQCRNTARKSTWTLYVTDAGLAHLARLTCLPRVVLHDAKDGLGLPGIDASSEMAAITKAGVAPLWQSPSLQFLSIHPRVINVEDIYRGPGTTLQCVNLVGKRLLSQALSSEIGVGEGSVKLMPERVILQPPTGHGPQVVILSHTEKDPQIDVLRYMPRLKKLELNAKRYPSCPARDWEELRFVPGLEEFMMPVTGDANDWIDAAGIRRLGEMKELRRLVCRLPDDFAAEDLAPLANLENLESLNIYCAGMTAEHTGVLSQLKSLHELRILGPPESGPVSIGAQHLADLKQLTELELYGVTDDDVSALAEIESLEELSLRSSSISDEAFESFGDMPLMWRLKVDSRDIDGERRKRIAELLPGMAILWN